MIASLIGPNGAGKTTLFNTLTGLYRPDGGEIRFQERSLIGMKPDRITSAGISRTFQNIRLFSHMTVLDNVLVGMHSASALRAWRIFFWRRKDFMPAKRQRASAGHGADRAYRPWRPRKRMGAAAVLRRAAPAGNRPRVGGGSRPLLLLDEPTAGMNTSEAQSLMALFKASHG